MISERLKLLVIDSLIVYYVLKIFKQSYFNSFKTYFIPSDSYYFFWPNTLIFK